MNETENLSSLQPGSPNLQRESEEQRDSRLRLSLFKAALARMREDPAEADRIDAILEESDEDPDDPIELDDEPGNILGSATNPRESMTVYHTFSDFYKNEYSRAVRFLMKNGANPHDAQDSAQDAFMEALQAVDRHDGWEQDTYSAARVYRVALHYYRRALKAGRKALRAEGRDDLLPEVPLSVPDQAELIDQALDLLAAIRTLPSKPRAVMAYYLDGFTNGDIADYLGITQETVSFHRMRALEKLRDAISDTSTESGADSDSLARHGR